MKNALPSSLKLNSMPPLLSTWKLWPCPPALLGLPPLRVHISLLRLATKTPVVPCRDP